MSNSTNETQVEAAREYFSKIQRLDESVFLGLQITGGQILLPLLVLTTIFSRKAPRSSVFINFCISWILYSIVYSLLVYRGRSDPFDLSVDPSAQECLVQASLINGVQAMTSCATIGVVIQLFCILKNTQREKSGGLLFDRKRHVLAYALLFVPFFAFLVFSIVSVVLGNSTAIDMYGNMEPDSNLALPGAFYCVILFNSANEGGISSGSQLIRASYIFASIVSLLSLSLEALVAILVFRQRSLLRRLLPNGSLSLLIRIVTFSVYRFLALGLNLAVIIAPDEIFLTGVSTNNLFNGVIDFIQAAIPLVAFLIFATEKDILSAWRSPESWTLRPWKEVPDPRSNVKRKNSDDSDFAVLKALSSSNINL
ncbi:hypothetical protein SCHPADRAFT_399713 [Schizopora paradoxa]|uniref:Fungal pheromone STE3G-protein-coupled receptor n=1 Tax=Schizopora paradoxa TaxID=27342 RepID=A0A0H2RMC0_9AGAM|nr:hypothetical protein SCHPADRAFT_399713 [Schizopora paradoxa]